MSPSYERFRSAVLVAVVTFAVAVAGAGCSTAAESPVEIPGPAASVAVAPDDYGTIWLTTAAGAYRSQDGGDSWRQIPGSQPGGTIAFGAKHAYVYGPWGARIGSFGGTRLVPSRPAPVPLAAVTSPYYLSYRFYGLDRAGRLWGSVNAGRTWSRLRAVGLPAGGIAIAARRQDPVLPDTIFVAAGVQGLWKSTDYGASFHRISGVDARAVATTAHNASWVLVADTRGILLSTNDGASFRRVLRDPGITAVALDTRNYENAFAATRRRTLLRSDNGGVSWKR